MKSLQLYILLIIFSTLVQSCKKDESKHPEINTTEIKVLNSGKIYFKGNIVNKGTFNITDYGFAYSQNSFFEANNSSKISLGKDVKDGEFSTESDIFFNNINYNRTIYVRAYITNDNGTAYGEVLAITLPTQSASNLVPSSGKTGDIIEIFGQFFNAQINEVKVTFGNANAKINSVTSTKITVEVPANAVSSSYSSPVTASVRVFINNSIINSDYTFGLIPTVKDFFPKSGFTGSQVRISGEYFPYSNSNFRVFFDEVEVGYSVSSINEITAYVPVNLTSAKPKLSVSFNGARIPLGEFTLTTPTITSINPIQNIPGTTVTVSGAGFPTSYSNLNSLLIGNTSVSFNSSSSNSLYFTVPNGLAEGDHTIKLTTGAFNIESPIKFKVVYPNIQSFTPTTGGFGEEITLTGNFYPGTPYTVTFGNTNATVKSITANTLVVLVPASSIVGNMKISIISGGKTNTNPIDFNIKAASITSFSPTTGIAGEIITIRGTGFNINNVNTVRFGSINAQILSASATEIRAVVPSNLLPAEMKITVIANNQTIVSTDNFTSK